VFGKWILAAAILAMPTYALAQVQSGVQSGVQGGVQTGVQSGVRSGFDHDNSGTRYGQARGPAGDWLDEITADCPKKIARDTNDPCGARCLDLAVVL
jgi:hypothetical protein